MIFASDLDRTLIYTKKFLLEGLDKTIPVDFKEDREISYMLEEAYSNLKEISNKSVFIPVTTRISAELKRIKGFDSLNIPYAITTNGAKIFIGKEDDLEWWNLIQSELNQMEVTPSELGPFLKEQFLSHLDCVINYVEDTYVSITFKEDDKEKVVELIDPLTAKVESLGFDYGYTGNKLFILPKSVTKKRALLHLLSKIEKDIVVTAGDSLMDLEIVQLGDKSFVPKHGEIELKNLSPENSEVTKEEGLKAGLEITQRVLDLLK